MAAKQVSETLI